MFVFDRLFGNVLDELLQRSSNLLQDRQLLDGLSGLSSNFGSLSSRSLLNDSICLSGLLGGFDNLLSLNGNRGFSRGNNFGGSLDDNGSLIRKLVRRLRYGRFHLMCLTACKADLNYHKT